MVILLPSPPPHGRTEADSPLLGLVPGKPLGPVDGVMGETHTLIFALFPSMGLYCGYCMVCISADVSLALKMQSVGWSSAGGCQQGCHVLCMFLCDFNISIWSFPAHCNKTSLRCMFSSPLSVLVRERDGFKVRRVDVLSLSPPPSTFLLPCFFLAGPSSTLGSPTL